MNGKLDKFNSEDRQIVYEVKKVPVVSKLETKKVGSNG